MISEGDHSSKKRADNHLQGSMTYEDLQLFSLDLIVVLGEVVIKLLNDADDRTRVLACLASDAHSVVHNHDGKYHGKTEYSAAKSLRKTAHYC